MNRITGLAAVAAAAWVASAVAAPAGAPAGSMGMCKDGTYSTSAAKKGACRGHQGVKEWYGAAESSGAGAVAPSAAAAAAPSVPAPAPSMAKKPASFTPAATAAAGGGPGLVWVNGSSNVYHCSGDKWYGKTKSGSYMSEADAKAKGDHPDHGKACTQ